MRASVCAWTSTSTRACRNDHLGVHLDSPLTPVTLRLTQFSQQAPAKCLVSDCSRQTPRSELNQVQQRLIAAT